MLTRRNFIRTATIMGSTVYFSNNLTTHANPVDSPEISCQQYPWYTFFLREGKNWADDLESSINQFSTVGFSGFEPSFASVKEVEYLHPILQKYHVSTHSFYVNSILHEPSQIEANITEAVNIAKTAKALGVRILVTNPSPIKWGGSEDKSDEQLAIQARALNSLGEKLGKMDLQLAYHNHDTEMRKSAREFHHMMSGTDPDNVKLCLDAHWIYRGSGNSQIALFDIVNLYVDRIVELHLRQSKEGIWTEEFTEGDIDYNRLSELLKSNKIKPHIVLEQSIENDSPHTMDAVEAHRLGLVYAKEVFNWI